MVELQDLPCRIVEVDMQDFPTTIVDELELWESIENTRYTYKACRRTNTRRVYVRRGN